MLMLGSVGVVLGSGLLAWPFARLLHVERPNVRAADDVQQLRQHGTAARRARVSARAGFSPMVALFTISNLLHFTLGVWIIDHHAQFGNLLRNPMVIVDRARASRSPSRIRRCPNGWRSRSSSSATR